MILSLLLTTALLPGTPTPATAETLTQLVAVSAARASGIEVLSRSDVEELAAFEGDRAAIGCDDAGSCLAEVAGALGAQLLIFGQLGELGDQLVLTLNLFDASTATSASRVVVRAANVGKIGDGLDAAVAELLSGREKARLFVMDLRVAGSGDVSDPEPAPADDGMSIVSLAGGSVLGVGLVVVIVGVFYGAAAAGEHDLASNPATTQANAATAIVSRDELAGVSNGIYLAGGIVALVGAGVLGFGMVME